MRVFGCRPVVVLAERDKADMDEQLRIALKGYKVDWHTRSGAPHNLSDLARVAAGQARSIILLEPEGGQVRFLHALVQGMCACIFVAVHVGVYAYEHAFQVSAAFT